MEKAYTTLIIIILGVILLTGCSKTTDTADALPQQTTGEQPQSSSSGQAEQAVKPQQTIETAQTSDSSQTADSQLGIQTYSLTQVKEHDKETDCWQAINGKVYDFTDYIASGEHVPQIVDGCGIDATSLFESIGKHSSPKATGLLEVYYIGDLA
jgi:cytochrome b involved in lipid metabolism